MSLPTVIALLQQGDAFQARELLRAQPLPGAEQDFLLGVCAHLLNEIPEAVQHFTAALKQEPAHARAAAALSALYAGLGRPDQAEILLRQTLARVDDGQLRFNLAVALEKQQKTEAALQEYSHLLEQDPNHYGARHNRAGLHSQQLKLREAATDYRELVKRHAGVTLPWQNLADIEISLGRYDDALRLLDEVRRREPQNSKALQSQAIAHAASGNFVESDACFRALKAQDPGLWESARQKVDVPHEHSTDIDPRLIFLVRQYEHLEVCQWRDWALTCETWHEYLRAPGSGELHPLAYRALMMPLSAAEQLQLAHAIDRQQRGTFTPSTLPVTPTPSRLRVAYMSAGFGAHATGVLLRKFLAAHNPASIQVILILLKASDGSAIASEIQSAAHEILDISAMSDPHARHAIRELKLDILVDANGYTSGSRPGLLLERLSPVQLHWLIMPSTTGSPSIDYYVCDAHVRPDDGWCSEAEVLMPQSYFVFSPPTQEVLPAPPRATLGLPENRFVFCCLNAAQKIDPDTFTLWMDLLKEIPDSVLWLLGGNTAVIMNLKREAEWRGMDPRRLLFAPKIDQHAHMARMGAADLFVDTFICNAHTTAAEALWAGLPVLTCPGDTYPSRVGKSLLLSCGLPELIANDRQDYKQRALRAARDPQWLAGLRARLAENRWRADIFNVHTQARHVEKAYRHMRERFAQGLTPAPFNIADLPD
jgi:protein O-GlcNAc transferase